MTFASSAGLSDLEKDLEVLLNRYSAEKGSDTPDFILAQYLRACMLAFDEATEARDRWWYDTPEDRAARVRRAVK